MSDEVKKEMTIQIMWPDFSFPPVNLTICVPAWFFYSNAVERKEYLKNVMEC